jgi:hypothetical protein
MNTTLTRTEKKSKRKASPLLVGFVQEQMPDDEMLRWFYESPEHHRKIGTFEEESKDCITLEEFSKLLDIAIEKRFSN